MIDFAPHKHIHLYNTAEYAVYIVTIAMMASDEALIFIRDNITYTLLRDAAMQEIQRRAEL